MNRITLGLWAITMSIFMYGFALVSVKVTILPSIIIGALLLVAVSSFVVEYEMRLRVKAKKELELQTEEQ